MVLVFFFRGGLLPLYADPTGCVFLLFRVRAFPSLCEFFFHLAVKVFLAARTKFWYLWLMRLASGGFG